ncbi:hypothetical protein ACIRRA_39870 [Nocardia sp. NPDC101769]|uniref:hypothetical protein n=1 Tax=Nocardia sp. NPDC101769 TaxID=3364333 RepID=UPI003826E7BA
MNVRKVAIASAAITTTVCVGVAHADPAPSPSPQAPKTSPSPQAAAPQQQQVVPAPVQVQELPVAAPPRQRPKQQEPTVTMTQDDGADTTQAVETPAAPVIVDPHLLRVGTTKLEAPDWISADTVHAAQGASDAAEWWAAYLFDQLGYPKDAADHAAAAALAGGSVGGYLGGVISVPVAAIGGCFAGMAIGGLAGAAIGGIPTAGVAGPVGAAIGGVIGCAVGGVVVGVPALVAGAALGAMTGGALGNALGDQLDQGKAVADTAPVAEAPAPQPVETAPTVAEQVAASGPAGDQLVTNLRGALDSMPALDPGAPFAAPINDLLGAARAAVA